MAHKVVNFSSHELSAARRKINETRVTSETRGLTFVSDFDRSTLPFPQYGVGDVDGQHMHAYNLTKVDMQLDAGTCGVWTIRSLDIQMHPFHIHVNPFMVLDVQSDFSNKTELMNLSNAIAAGDVKAIAGGTVGVDYTPPLVSRFLKGTWRDTVMVPPFGSVTIKQCYDAGWHHEQFAGKFIFHCHFLTHEDTGLLHNVILRRNQSVADASV